MWNILKKLRERKNKKFVKSAHKIIGALNELSVVHPEAAPVFNRVTDMLEQKIKDTVYGNETI